MTDDVLTAEQVAEMLGVTKKCLYKWRYEDRGPRSTRPGRDLVYLRSDVEDWKRRRDAATAKGGEL